MERCCKSAKSDNSLDDSLTNIQWLYHLESPENLLNSKTMNFAVMRDNGACESNEKETEPSPKNPHLKPPYSYATLILLAINSSQKKKMTLQEIYKWIEENFPYYRRCKKAWKNSIRHNLSLHSFFIKEQRPSGHPGKGNYWCLSPEGKENVVKEVMKHSQPVIQIPLPVQASQLGSASGLRPILPKPSAGSTMSMTAGGIMGNIGILANGVQYSVPVLFVPSTGTDVTSRPLEAEGRLEPIQECSEPTTTDAEESLDKNCEMKSEAVAVNGSSYKMGLLPEYSGKVEGNDVVFNKKETFESQCSTTEFTTESKCVENVLSSGNRQNLTDSNKNEYCVTKRRSSCGAQEHSPMSPKRAKQSDIKKLTSPPVQLARSVRIRRSPLRTCTQPTLAAINSQASDCAGTANEFRHFFDDFGVMTSSPVKPITTPLKEWNNIRGSLNTPNWLSPNLGTSSVGFNSKTGFTPLRYDSDSGFFTPVKDSEFDFNFLLSPNRLAVDPSPKTKTKEGCRKSLHLGTNRVDEPGHESLLDWLQI